MSNDRRVVITGLGVVTPIGMGVEPFWDALMEKKCGLKRIESFDPSGFASQIGGELPPFKLTDYIPKTYRKNAKVMSRDIKIAVACAYHAVTDASIQSKCIIDRGEAPGPPNVDSTRFGANIGAGSISADLNELAGALATAKDEDHKFDIKRWGAEGMENLTPLWLLKFLPNMLASHVTIVHDCQAPCNAVTCGEASGHLAIGEAFRTIARGDADVCICGGAESKIAPMALARSHLLERLNPDCNDRPTDACRPFGQGARGTAVAEGGGLILLEALDHAKSRNARIYAELSGFGAAGNAFHWADPDPKGQAITLSLKKACADAGVEVADIDLVSPFGIGIGNMDASEMTGWNAVFGDRLCEIPAITTRPATGFCGAGCGAIDFAATVMSLYRNTVPPTPNTDALAETCRFSFVQRDPVDARIRAAVTLGYSLAGGQTAALVVKRFEE